MNKDQMLRGVLAQRQVRFTAISASEMVDAARATHSLSRVCTAALGRTLMACAMLAWEIKDPNGKLTAILKGGGPAGNVVCTARPDGQVKGYVENPGLELPLAPNGKLDVAMAVGWFGDMTVVRDLGLKEPYVGTCAIRSGEIAEDFANYLAVSEQQPALVYLGVHVAGGTGQVTAAGGLILSPLPGCPDEVLDDLTARASDIGGLTARLEAGESLETVVSGLLGDLDLEILDREGQPCFRCDCSRERLEGVLLALGREELTDMMEKDRGAELHCQFCNQTYRFTEQELGALLERAQHNEENE